MTHQNGDVFEGIFENDHICGFGVLRCTNGNYFEGNWQNSRWHGQGKLMDNGNLYVGEFFNNNFEGQGTMVYYDQSEYTGNWKENRVCLPFSSLYPIV